MPGMALRVALSLLLAILVTICRGADHPCESEVQSACPDRPGPDLAACLKDPSEHERPTTISSECTDFIAMNTACAPDISKYCEDAFFSRDTVLCLTVWTDQDSLSPKCKSVLEWAAPKKQGDGDGDGPTDELGMSEKDYEEKRQWQAQRRAARGAAIEKLRSDAQDAKDMERQDGETEEDYKQRMKEREEAERSRQEMLKRKRLMEAAAERKRREEAGEPLEPEEEEKQPRGRRRVPVKSKDEKDWLPYALGGLAVAFVIFNVLNFLGVGEKKDD